MGEFLLLSMPNFAFLTELKSKLEHDSNFIRFRQAIMSCPNDRTDNVLAHDLILQ